MEFIGRLVYCFITAGICYFIMQQKGYDDDKCFSHAIGGFFLNLIWVAVVLLKKKASDVEKEKTGKEHDEPEFTEISMSKEKGSFCKICGSKVNANDIFCSNCGNKLDD